MNPLSITFHCTDAQLKNWEEYINQFFLSMIDDLIDVKEYIFSEVNTDMLAEGKNFNLLLFFETKEMRKEFIKNELVTISQRIESKFANEVMIFPTFLHLIQYRLGK